MRLGPDTPLKDAKIELNRRLMDRKQHFCPCCSQAAQLHRWSIYGTAAVALILLYRTGDTSRFVHTNEIKGQWFRDRIYAGQGDCSRLRHWGLVEREKDLRPDGGKSGNWRVTPLGAAFVLGEATVPKYILIYDNELKGMEGEHVSISDAIGVPFNYREHMDGGGDE
jgi:hypothetical protein